MYFNILLSSLSKQDEKLEGLYQSRGIGTPTAKCKKWLNKAKTLSLANARRWSDSVEVAYVAEKHNEQMRYLSTHNQHATTEPMNTKKEQKTPQRACNSQLPTNVEADEKRL